ncbi:MAG: hypothetical protein WC814_01980 [Candidatus Paceibacterota bacterium]|jgi:hypothetical protein
MGLDYSQKQLLSAPLQKRGGRSARTRRLQLYAVMTGFLSTLISLATTIVLLLK